MKTDYIYNIPAGPELDKLVAEKVMGWHMSKEIVWVAPDGRIIRDNNWIDADGRIMYGIPPDDRSCEDGDAFFLANWHPSESIIWAWEVVEKMGLSYKLESIHYLSGTVHRATFWRGMMAFPVEAETISLAICRSALLTMTYSLE